MTNKQDNYLKIAELISEENKEVLELVSKMLENPIDFYYEYQDDILEELIFCTDVEDLEEDELIWEELIEILISKNFVCSRDWKDELEDFLYFLGNLETAKQFNLNIERMGKNFNEEEDISIWINQINEIINEDYKVAEIYEDSDSYNLFICRTDIYKKLKDIEKTFEKEMFV